jgi:hypothetical protein
MKKLESVFKDLPGCGITNARAILPRIFWGVSSLVLPKKFTIKRGEGTITALKNPLALTFSRRKRVKFDITETEIRRYS